jgi:hypothetical protein
MIHVINHQASSGLDMTGEMPALARATSAGRAWKTSIPEE